MNAIDEIIKDLERIPDKISTVIDVKKIADEVSKELQKKTRTRFS